MTLDSFNTKSILSSQTFWGVLAGAIPGINEAAQQLLAIPGLPTWVAIPVGIVGSIAAVLGRIKATQKIG